MSGIFDIHDIPRLLRAKVPFADIAKLTGVPLREVYFEIGIIADIEYQRWVATT
jgi:hypothetical protein